MSPPPLPPHMHKLWTMAALPFLSYHFAQVITFSCCCRGIDVVRNKIKMFAQQKVTLPKGRHKVIILDEADRYVQERVETLSYR